MSSESSVHQLVGVVTKMFPTFGYINNDIFFQRKCVLGPMVEVGDHVAANAVYQPNMPIKWSAEKVWQVQDSSRGRPINDDDKKYWSEKSPRRKVDSKDTRSRGRDSPTHRDSIVTPVRKRQDQSGNKRVLSTSDRNDLKRRRLSPPRSVHSRSPLRREGPSKKTTDAKCLLSVKELIIPDIHFRYPGLFAPVDLYRLVCHWQDSFPLLRPLQSDRSTCYQILNKPDTAGCLSEVANEGGYYVNVLLLSIPSVHTLQEKTIVRAECPDQDRISIRKYIKILSVSKPKKRLKAIGGSWNRELDGSDPAKNPQVLIRTAIRVCKQYLGLDLSHCTQWHRFLEFRYSRTEGSTARPTSVLFPGSKLWGRTFPEVPENKTSDSKKPFHRIVVYFIPDAWSIMPSADNWTTIKNAMENALSCGVSQSFPLSDGELKEFSRESAAAAITTDAGETAKGRDVADSKMDVLETQAATSITEANKGVSGDKRESESVVSTLDSKHSDETGLQSPATSTGAGDTQISEDGGGTRVFKKSHDEINLAAMKVSELREQLKVRNLPADGIKAQLLSRLKAALEKEVEEAKKLEEEKKRKEKEAEEALAVKEAEKLKESNKTPTSTEVTSVSSVREGAKVVLRNYPSIVIQNRFPNDHVIQTVSLDNILEAKTESMDSQAYEFLLCAYNLLDMIRRDSIFTLFRALVSAGDRGVQAKPRSKGDTGSKHEREDHRDRDPNSGTSKEKPPLVTVDAPLLCACTYLDAFQIGYFHTDEVEEMIFTLGLPVSRYQVRSLVTKVADDHRIYYRALTDAEVSPALARSTALYSEIDDDEYLLELIRGGDAILDEQNLNVPTNCVLVLRDSNLEMVQSTDSSASTQSSSAPEVFAQHLWRLELERNKFKRQLQIKTEEVDRLRMLTDEISSLKEKLTTSTTSAEDYKRRLRNERDRMHSACRILDQQVASLESSRSALRQVVGRLRGYDEDPTVCKKTNSGQKSQDSSTLETKPQEKLTDPVSKPDPDMTPVDTKDTSCQDTEVTEKELTPTKDVPTVSVTVDQCKSPVMVNGLTEGDDSVDMKQATTADQSMDILTVESADESTPTTTVKT